MSMRRTILIADANEQTRELLGQFLEMQGFDVCPVDGGMKAQAMARQRPPAAALIDTALQDMTPSSLVAEFASPMHRIPTIVLDQHPAPDRAVTYMTAGACGYLGYPFDFSKLMGEVHQALQRSAEAGADGASLATGKRQIAGYTIIETIARTSSSNVFLGEKDGVRVAIKVMRGGGETPADRKRQRRRFQRSAIVASSVKHPNIVRIIDFGMDERQQVPYLVMEHVVGQSVGSWRKAQPPGSHVAMAEVLRQLASALQALHDKGICVRTLNPHNLMVTGEGQIKLLDFIFAMLPNSDLTIAGELAGLPEYMAPEVLTDGEVTARADIFSIGVVAYELLLGRKPFYSSSLADLARQITTEAPLDPRQIDAALPPELQAMLAQMLHKAPERRYASMAAVVDDLSRFIEGQPLQGTTSGLRERLFGSRVWRQR